VPDLGRAEARRELVAGADGRAVDGDAVACSLISGESDALSVPSVRAELAADVPEAVAGVELEAVVHVVGGGAVQLLIDVVDLGVLDRELGRRPVRQR
jgi:hypothetical protein